MKKSIRYFSFYFYSVTGIVCIVLVLLYSKDISTSLIQSINVCLQTLVPSLFTFMVFSNFAIQTHILDLVLSPFSLVTRYIYKLDASLTPTIIMSMLGGYPVGARLLSNLVNEKKISAETAERMLCFCVNAGPAYVIGAVSIPMFGNSKVGLIIFLSHIIASFAIGFMTGIGKKPGKMHQAPQPVQYIVSLVDSVSLSAKAMVNMCSFVLLFSAIITILNVTGISFAFLSILNLFMSPELAQCIFNGVLEITNGVTKCYEMQGVSSVITVSALTAFGGLCVHMQAISMFRKIKIRMAKFYMTRIVYTFISAASTYFLLLANGISLEVFSANPAVEPYLTSSTPIGSIFLIILCVILLLSSKKSATII